MIELPFITGACGIDRIDLLPSVLLVICVEMLIIKEIEIISIESVIFMLMELFELFCGILKVKTV